MSQLSERIAQFQKMTNDDPDNELGHFRLGQLYMEAEDFEKAIESFNRTLEISPQFSKVYQLLSDCLIKLDRQEEAVSKLTEGWKIADERGDKMPRDAMGDMLKKLNAPVPQVQKKDAYDGPDTGFRCQRPTCMAGRGARQLARPPIPDEIGKRIYREICSECWEEWFKNYSVKVINETRIDLSTEYGQEEYDKYMRSFLGFEEPAGV
ncbi:Fe(2+)-trafficking protein [Telmatocola sphagniphila]|jgi:Fe-S cluster biosynthesis and repair protein YggX|uniref:Fe(2+)-trafficking protein n=1 Tax=Telmatocola sphagniphila TaxID=1123043 RepID=A0A8E6EW36_9BACT|nr:Fe(2+)-trafficking protein [Telmatocola sphagniphila]QVL30173.1 Fe(2+)-trafficking protein [Telmatocola sphagniphila]